MNNLNWLHAIVDPDLAAIRREMRVSANDCAVDNDLSITHNALERRGLADVTARQTRYFDATMLARQLDERRCLRWRLLVVKGKCGTQG